MLIPKISYLNIGIFVTGIIIGIVIFYVFYRFKYKINSINLVVQEKDTVQNCIDDYLINPKSFLQSSSYLKEKFPTSYILQINNKNVKNLETVKDYYEVSIYDKKDNLLYIKDNINQIDLSSISNSTNINDFKYKIFSPLCNTGDDCEKGNNNNNNYISYNIYKVPKLTQTFNPPSLNVKALKKYTDIEIDYQSAMIDKLIENHNFIVKKEIFGNELKNYYEGILSRKSKIYITQNDFLEIHSKDITRSFLIYPSNGILTSIENINIKNTLHENFNVKIEEINLQENINSVHTVSCVFPLLNYNSALPIFKMIFV